MPFVIMSPADYWQLLSEHHTAGPLVIISGPDILSLFW
jgi:hypothetical protein